MISKTKHELLPVLRKLPFAETVSYLHQHNLKVAQVCLQSSNNNQKHFQMLRNKYEKTLWPQKQEQLRQAHETIQKQQHSIEERKKNLRKKNEENMEKLKKAMEKRRDEVNCKQAKMMQGSVARRQNYLKKLASSFHRSSDKRFHILKREDSEMNRSMALLQHSTDKVEKACGRKQQIINEFQVYLHNKIEGEIKNAGAKRQQLQQSHSDRDFKKMIQKYMTNQRNFEQRAANKEEQIIKFRKAELENLEKHSKKRSDQMDKRELGRENNIKKTEEKTSKAILFKQNSMMNLTNQLKAKGTHKRSLIKQNTFYLDQEHRERIAILQDKRLARDEYRQALDEGKQQLHRLAQRSSLFALRT